MKRLIYSTILFIILFLGRQPIDDFLMYLNEIVCDFIVIGQEWHISKLIFFSFFLFLFWTIELNKEFFWNPKPSFNNFIYKFLSFIPLLFYFYSLYLLADFFSFGDGLGYWILGLIISLFASFVPALFIYLLCLLILRGITFFTGGLFDPVVFQKTISKTLDEFRDESLSESKEIVEKNTESEVEEVNDDIASEEKAPFIYDHNSRKIYFTQEVEKEDVEIKQKEEINENDDTKEVKKEVVPFSLMAMVFMVFLLFNGPEITFSDIWGDFWETVATTMRELDGELNTNLKGPSLAHQLLAEFFVIITTTFLFQILYILSIKIKWRVLS